VHNNYNVTTLSAFTNMNYEYFFPSGCVHDSYKHSGNLT